MLYWLKQLIPQFLLALYHFFLAKLAVFLYRNPSKEMIVIGVTGTNGKSSTVQFMAQILKDLGHTVGYTTTAGFSIAGKDIENAMKMTMPGRFYLQSLMRRMADAGCDVAIIETSSQGIAQYRHIGLNYDIAMLTNLTPEHIEAHGSFELYKQAKGELFAHLTKRPHKIIDGKVVEKSIVVNIDDKYSGYFLDFTADTYKTFGWGKSSQADIVGIYKERSMNDVRICINGEEASVRLRASFQHRNLLAAVSGAVTLGEPIKKCVQAAGRVDPVPGRFEFVNVGQPFFVIVDYAYEPYALRALINDVKALKPNRIIGVHGSAGGGRDVLRRELIGEFAGQEEDFVIVTNEDPYDEDPIKIIQQVARGAKNTGKKEGKDLFLVEDRLEGVFEAISKAKKGDAVIITGKGSEPVIAIEKGRKLPWSDREAAILSLKRLGYTRHD